MRSSFAALDNGFIGIEDTSGILKRTVSIHIGEYYGSRNPAVILTLLGSCVAVCLHDPVNRVGGMNHIFLPGRADLKNFDATARYGVNAMEMLINRLMRLGADRHLLKAKVFGGAHILSSISRENGVGKKNAEFALEFLRNEGISILGSDLGGTRPRRVQFHTDTGEVLLTRFPTVGHSDLLEKEKAALDRIHEEVDLSGKVTLF